MANLGFRGSRSIRDVAFRDTGFSLSLVGVAPEVTETGLLDAELCIIFFPGKHLSFRLAEMTLELFFPTTSYGTSLLSSSYDVDRRIKTVLRDLLDES